VLRRREGSSSQLILLLTEHFEIALHAIQPVHIVLEVFRQAPEERGHMTVLELVESTDDPIRLLACFHLVNETVEP